MSVVGQARSYHKRFLFRVEIPGVAWAGFQKCGELKETTAVISQWEGAGQLTWNAAYTSPGRVKTSDVTLERGATSDLDLWRWYRQVSDAGAGSGAVDEAYKRSVQIVQLDRDGNELRRFALRAAWPTEYSAGDRDNTADGNSVESLTLTYEYFELSDDRAA